MPSSTMEKVGDMATKLNDCWLFKRKRTNTSFPNRQSKLRLQEQHLGGANRGRIIYTHSSWPNEIVMARSPEATLHKIDNIYHTSINL